MITLAIDTSTTLGSVAVIKDGTLLFGEQFTADRSHSSHLFSCLERALQAAPGCDQIVIGLGPGSYSGVRIAISAAIGFEFGMKARLFGIASAAAIDTEATHYQTIGDARRDTFYYARICDGVCQEGPLLLTSEALKEKLAAHPGLPVFTSDAIPDFPRATIGHPSAERLARLAELGTGIHSTGDLEPIYLREPHITQPKKIS
jgi:tRNA threonylcarbamoyl adenosine modification protein YeaZ